MNKKNYKVLGYIKPTSSFHTIEEWENLAVRLLDLQQRGWDTRGGEISCKNMRFCSKEDYEEFILLIVKYLFMAMEQWQLILFIIFQK